MPTCPEGHQTTATDYCDVCGSPVTAGPPAPVDAQVPGVPLGTPPKSSAPPAGGVPCPNCGAMNPPEALFCEACGYDYTTGTMPRTAEQAADWLSIDTPAPTPTNVLPKDATPAAAPGLPQGEPVLPAAPSVGDAQPPSTEAPADVPAAVNGPAEHSEQHDAPVTPQAAEAEQQPTSAANQGDDVPPVADTPAADTPTNAAPAEAGVAPAGTAEATHVAEVWIDPDWFAVQQSGETMPSPGLPTIVPIRAKSVLIGRESRSRNIHPEIDCGTDTGVSRRQAQLTTDGQRWFVEDLESSNGTFLAHADDPLPETPVTAGKHELAEDDRIYVGAWTRVVLRRALPGEVEQLSGN